MESTPGGRSLRKLLSGGRSRRLYALTLDENSSKLEVSLMVEKDERGALGKALVEKGKNVGGGRVVVKKQGRDNCLAAVRARWLRGGSGINGHEAAAARDVREVASLPSMSV
jgi:hypothetical protein